MEIGQVLRSSTEGFTCGTRSQDVEGPQFGAFVRTESRNDDDSSTIVGVITAIRVDDDPLVRQLIMASNGNGYTNAIRDQRENRMVPIEIDVLSVGYANGEGVHHALPPRPPFSLDSVVMCVDDEVLAFTEDLSFFRLLLNGRGRTSSAELLAAVIHQAARVRRDAERRAFLINIGRQLTTWLDYDLKTLQHVLSLIRPLAV
jgi:hypothetical protein